MKHGILALLLAGFLAGAFGQETPAKPNIIFILSDDVGLGDIGCCGGAFKTPQLDALAKSGTRFEYCYSTPLCGPSRCQFLTGRYPFRTGLINNQSHNAVAPSREIMIPTVLKKAGYVTASVGKWGQICFGPGEWGFDEYLVFPGSGRYWRDQTTHYNVNGVQKNLPAGVYLPDLMHDFVVEFLNRHKDQPFFLYYPMSHCHGPIVATPDSKAGGKGQLYADNVAYMDKLVGKLMAELDRLHLREKTAVLFSGDNGTARFGVGQATVNGQRISGMKATMLEGGSRVPLLVSWPGTTPAGKVSRDLTDFSDFLPTFAELAGAKLPEGVTIDGHSFAAQIKGQAGTPREWVYVELNGKHYAATSRWKLNQAGELFDLKGAPFKEIPVARDTADNEAVAARKHLQEVLDGLVQQKPAEAKDGNAGRRGRRRGKNAQP
jgi:arylsulfatase A